MVLQTQPEFLLVLLISAAFIVGIAVVVLQDWLFNRVARPKAALILVLAIGWVSFLLWFYVGIGSPLTESALLWLVASFFSFGCWNLRHLKPGLFLRESDFYRIVLPALVVALPFLVIFVTVIASLALFNVAVLNVISVVAASGVLAVVIGLSLQDTIQNFFSGYALKAENYFAVGDLIKLSDGVTYHVKKITQRTTTLYNFKDHTYVFVSNSNLVNANIVNMTRPTRDLRVEIEVGFSYQSDLKKEVVSVLLDKASRHPNILLSDFERKVDLLLESIRERIPVADPSDNPPLAPAAVGQTLTVDGCIEKVRKNEASAEVREFLAKKGGPEVSKLLVYIDRARAEGHLDQEIKMFRSELRTKVNAVATSLDATAEGRESEETAEMQEADMVDVVKSRMDRVLDLTNAWLGTPDPDASDDEWREELAACDSLNDNLRRKVAELQRYSQRTRSEFKRAVRLRDRRRGRQFKKTYNQPFQDFADWLAENYKEPIDRWKDPIVTFKSFGDSSVNLVLHFYVDNIKFEHYLRTERVIAEVAEKIHRDLKEKIPFPQLDLHPKIDEDMVGVIVSSKRHDKVSNNPAGGLPSDPSQSGPVT